MEKGISNMVKYIMKHMPSSTKDNIDDFIASIDLSRIETPSFTEQLKAFEATNRNYEQGTLKEYTLKPGYNFINSILRNRLNYEEHGIVTEEEKSYYLERAYEISEIIHSFPKTTSTFFTYRGTDLNEFSKYDIHSIDELEKMKGNYLYEQGFTSTSISRESSFFDKQLASGFKNIEIKYIIPENSNEGIPLLDIAYSYCPEEEEYLLDCSSLSKVLDVKTDGNKGYLTVALIPKQIWNVVTDNYSNTNNEESTKTI